MKYGVVSSFGAVDILADAGFDYIELVADDCIGLNISDDEWKGNLKKIRNAPIPALSVAGLIPPGLMLVGEDADLNRNLAYMDRLLARVQEAGIPTLVFGSNKARNIPEGFDPAVAAAQLEEFLEKMVDSAARRGVGFVLEPLRSECTNTFTTLASCAAMVRKLNRPNLGLLVDFFHFHRTDNDVPSLCWNAELLRHTHISTRNRRIPGVEPENYRQFMRILKASGYDRTMSIEGDSTLTRENAGPALHVLRSEWAQA